MSKLAYSRVSRSQPPPNITLPSDSHLSQTSICHLYQSAPDITLPFDIHLTQTYSWYLCQPPNHLNLVSVQPGDLLDPPLDLFQSETALHICCQVCIATGFIA